MTSLRLVCVLAVSALVFVGCDSNDDDNGGNSIDRVQITSVQINEFPDRQPDGDRWDGGLLPSDADLYYILYDADTDQELDSTEGDNFDDVDNSNTPLEWDGDYSSRDFDRRLVIELYDEDSSNEDDFIGSTDVFELGEAFDRSTLTVTGPETSILLRLDWN